MVNTDFDPFDVLNAIEIPVSAGKKTFIGGRICFSMMFFMAAKGDFTIPARLIEAEALVRRSLPLETYEHWTAQDPYRPTSIAKMPPPAPADLLDEFTTRQEEHSGALNFKLWNGRRDGKDAPTRLVSLFYERSHDRPSHAEYDVAESFEVKIDLPTLAAQGQQGFLQKLFVGLCELLRPTSAVGGLCLSTPLSAGVLQDNEHLLYETINNHPGLLVGQALDLAYGSRFGMSAVNWLTAIDQTLLERCGSAESVVGQLSLPEFQTKPFGSGGLIVQAGPSPQIGNVEAGASLPHYGQLARALQSARLTVEDRMPHVPAYGPEGVIYAPEVMIETQNAWLARFDEM